MALADQTWGKNFLHQQGWTTKREKETDLRQWEKKSQGQQIQMGVLPLSDDYPPFPQEYTHIALKHQPMVLITEFFLCLFKLQIGLLILNLKC